jgi:hypothetical protein
VVFSVKDDPGNLPCLELHDQPPKRGDHVLLLDNSPRVRVAGLRISHGYVQQIDSNNFVAFADYNGFSGSSGGSVIVASGRVIGLHTEIHHETEVSWKKKTTTQDVVEYLTASSGQSVFLWASQILTLINQKLSAAPASSTDSAPKRAAKRAAPASSTDSAPQPQVQPQPHRRVQPKRMAKN